MGKNIFLKQTCHRSDKMPLFYSQQCLAAEGINFWTKDSSIADTTAAAAAVGTVDGMWFLRTAFSQITFFLIFQQTFFK